MQLGFVSAILPDLGLEEVMQCAADSGFDCVEVMCWPRGKAERNLRLFAAEVLPELRWRVAALTG